MIGSVKLWYRPYQGGNMWGFWDSYITACRDILGLKLPVHEKYKFWEEAAINGGFRYMHEDFCMVSDFPAVLKKDDRNRPHSDDGPSHEWRDGWKLYHWHGIRLSAEQSYIVTDPLRITAADIDKENNQEVKRAMLERYGVQRYVQDGEVLDKDNDALGAPRVLYRKKLSGMDVDLVMLHVKNSTPEPDGSIKDYFLEIHPECRPMLRDKQGEIQLGEPQKLTCRNAVASTFGMRGEDYAPLVES